MPLIALRDLTKRYPRGVTALDGLTLDLEPGIIGLVGANGAGKSTLLKIMAGVDREFVGDARITEGFRAGLLAQEPALDAAKALKYETVVKFLVERGARAGSNRKG